MTSEASDEQVFEEVTEILRRRARHPLETTITYDDLTNLITTRSFHKQEKAYHVLLSDISTREDEAGRGLLSAVVVRSNGGLPGEGYFILAKSRGRDVSNERAHHEAELERVCAANRFTNA